MPVVSSRTDVATRRIELVSELTGTPAEVWALWAEPDRLARWWGPPGAPMEVEHHDLRPGGEVRFAVRLPGDTVVRGRFVVAHVEVPHALRFTFHSDGLDEASVDVAIGPLDAVRSRMALTVELPDDAALEHALGIGFDTGVARSLARADVALV